MRLFQIIFRLAFVTVAVLSALPVWAHEEQVIVVGRNAAGELKIDSDFDQPVVLPVSVFPGIPGYATGELALHSTIQDDPTNDFFQLSTAADFQLILLAKDPGMEVWNGTGYMKTNDTLSVGPSPFDNHPVWNLMNGTPGNAYSLTLKLHDLNGVYSDSEPFVLSFTPIQVRHRLEIMQLDPWHAMLSWTTNAAGWELLSAASVTAINWDVVTNVPATTGTNFTLSIAMTNTQRFFRLNQP